MKNDDFISLSPELMEKYKKQFFEPETFVEQNGKIKAIKANDPARKSIAEQLSEAQKQVERDRGVPKKNQNKSHEDR